MRRNLLVSKLHCLCYIVESLASPQTAAQGQDLGRTRNLVRCERHSSCGKLRINGGRTNFLGHWIVFKMFYFLIFDASYCSLPQLKLVKAFHDCDYKAYLHAMVEVEPILQADRYFQPHLAYWMRELHILAYKQFLDSYQSVTLQAMAGAFGVSQDFIDYHASRFIASGRLSAKIDKYGGVILTNRPDLKNAQYRETIQKGDMLLNRIQKLARVVDL